MRRTTVLIALVWSAGAGHAQPFKERLTREQIAAAGQAARARMPKVDRAAADACKATHGDVLGKPSHTAAELAAAAACFRAAGNVGLAIRLWTALVTEKADAPEAPAAERDLGAAYETAGSFSQAAEWHRAYAQHAARAPDARAELIRAVCIWRQLDLAEQANAAEKDLAQLPPARGKPPKSAALCKTVRPISVSP